MPYNTFYNKIITDENLMETISHGNTGYPFQFYYDNLDLFDFHCIEWHWHDEFEFVYIEQGPVSFWVGEKCAVLPSGSGVFINAKVPHRFFAESGGIIPNFVCMPSFLAQENSFLYSSYVLPVIRSSLDCVILSPQIIWQAEILKLYREIIALNSQTQHSELLISSVLQKIWHLLFQNAYSCRKEGDTAQKNGALARLQLMMQYIHANYARALSLEELCNYVHISKSTALHLFHQYLHTTPIRYLIRHRLQIAAGLLQNSEKSITAISMDCGFEHVDYFCKTFKKHYGITPLQYKNEKRGMETSGC